MTLFRITAGVLISGRVRLISCAGHWALEARMGILPAGRELWHMALIRLFSIVAPTTPRSTNGPFGAFPSPFVHAEAKFKGSMTGQI